MRPTDDKGYGLRSAPPKGRLVKAMADAREADAWNSRALVLARRVAASHDGSCSPDLRSQARALLDLGECEEWQNCLFRGGCELCATAGERAA